MKKSARQYDYSPLVPDFVLQLLPPTGWKRLKLPLVRTEEMGVLFMDVSGFTRYTEFASAKGYYGVERITGLLNSYFAVLHRIIAAYGGEIAKYGGDSCLILFRGERSRVISRLLACRNDIRRHIGAFIEEQKRQSGVDFNFHGAMAFGEVHVHIVGSPQTQLNFFLSGAALHQVYDMDAQPVRGDLQIPADWQTDPIPAVVGAEELADIPNHVHKPYHKLARHFLSPAVRHKLSDRSTKAELRNAAIIFINISDKDSAVISDARYQELYLYIQRWVQDFDGTINKIDYSDKGYIVIITFGVPQSHPDIIERAFLCAWRINQNQTGLRLKTGITGCNIYAGIIGSPDCFEYGIIGNGVNIAARLMSHSAYGEISLSESIVPKVQNRFEVSFCDETQVKGIKEPIKLYCLVRELPENWAAMQNAFATIPVIARQKTILDLQAVLLQEDNPLILIHGPSGAGKSFLIYQISHKLVEEDREVFYYSSDQVSLKRRLELFFQVIRRKLGITSFLQELDTICSWCQSEDVCIDPKLLKKWLFASKELVSTATSGTELQYEHNVVLNMLADLLAHLLKTTRLLIIDNHDSLDSESVALLKKLLPLLQREGVRTVVSAGNPTLKDIYRDSRRVEFALEPFGLPETIALVSHILPNATEGAIRKIHQLTEGNPLFIHELSTSLSLYLKDRHDLLTEAGLDDLEHREQLPESLENLFVRKYDLFSEQARSVLKLTSILAKGFTIPELCNYLPKSLQAHLEAILAELLDSRFLIIRTLDPEPEYAFANSIMREAIYRTILLSEKRQLHRSIALKLSKSGSEQVNEQLESIAGHFIKAEDARAVVKWAYLAGSKLTSLADYENCVFYYEAVLKSAEKRNDKLQAKLALAEALVLQGKITEATPWVEELGSLQKRQTILFDTYCWLYARFLNYSTQHARSVEILPRWLPRMQDAHLKAMVEIFLLDARFHLNDLEHFEAEALGLFEQFKLEGAEIYLSRITALLGQYYLNQGYYAKAKGYFIQRQELTLKQNDFIGQRTAYSNLGIVASRQGDKKTARKYYEKALAIAEKHGDRNAYSKVLLDLGTLYRNEGKYDAALDCYQRSLKLTELTQNKLQYSIVLYDIGDLYNYKEDYENAMLYFRQSLSVSEAIGDETGISFCQDAIGDMLFREGKFAEAEALYLKNLERQLSINDREGIGHTYGNLGNLAKVRDDYAQATDYYHKQIDILTEVGDVDGCGRAWFNLAMLDKERQRYGEALLKLNKALELFQSFGGQYFIEITQGQIAEIQSLSSQT